MEGAAPSSDPQTTLRSSGVPASPLVLGPCEDRLPAHTRHVQKQQGCHGTSGGGHRAQQTSTRDPAHAPGVARTNADLPKCWPDVEHVGLRL